MKKLVQLLRDNAAPRPVNIKAATADSGDATMYLYDVIDSYWGISAKSVADALAGINPAATLHVRVNSPGGDVFEARAIKTLLEERPGNTVVHVDGLAASAATTIAMAGDEIVMADGSYFMIHNAWSIALGNKADMTAMAALLEKMDGTIAADYAARTGKGVEEIAALMDAETWMTASEALAAGFVNRIAGAAESEPDGDEEPDEDDVNARAHWNLAAYDKTPKALTERGKPTAARQPDYAAIHANNRRRLRLLEIA